MTDNRGMAKHKTAEKEGNQALALLIRRAMDESGLLGKDIAELCEVKPQAVSNWKVTGRIDKQNLEKLADITRKPLSYFSTLKRSSGKGDAGYAAGAWNAHEEVAEQSSSYNEGKSAPKSGKAARDALAIAKRIQALPARQRNLLKHLLDELEQG